MSHFVLTYFDEATANNDASKLHNRDATSTSYKEISKIRTECVKLEQCAGGNDRKRL